MSAPTWVLKPSLRHHLQSSRAILIGVLDPSCVYPSGYLFQPYFCHLSVSHKLLQLQSLPQRLLQRPGNPSTTPPSLLTPTPTHLAASWTRTSTSRRTPARATWISARSRPAIWARSSGRSGSIPRHSKARKSSAPS